MDHEEIDLSQFESTTSNFTMNDDGSWTLAGVWVIDDFPEKKWKSKSGNFAIYDDIEMYITLLDPLGHTNIPVDTIIHFNSLNCQYPMDLWIRLKNWKVPSSSKSDEKISHVIFSQTALRSYLNFQVTWDQILDKNQEFINDNSQVMIEFEFTHTLKPYEISSRNLKEYIEQERQSKLSNDSYYLTNNVGLFSRENNDILNGLLISFYQIPIFRLFVYKTQSNETIAVAFQRIFSQLQTSHVSFSSKEFLQAIQWKDAQFDENLVDLSLKIIYDGWKEILKKPIKENLMEFTNDINEYLLFNVEKYIYDENDPNKQIGESESIYFNTIDLKPHDNKTIIELLSEFFGYTNNSTEVFVLRAIPNVAVLRIKRFNKIESSEIQDKIDIPFSINFFQFYPDSSEEKEIPENWTLKSVLNAYDEPFTGKYNLYVRKGMDDDEWLEFNSGKVLTIGNFLNVKEICLRPVLLFYTRESVKKTLYTNASINDMPEGIRILTPKYDDYIRILTEDDYKNNCLKNQIGCGLATNTILKIPYDNRIKTLLQEIKISCIKTSPHNNIRVWTVDSNGTPDFIIDDYDNRVDQVFEQNNYAFVQVLKEKESPLVSDTEIVLFLKVYFSGFGIQYLDSIQVSKSTKIEQLSPIVNKLLSTNVFPILFFLEKQNQTADLIDTQITLEDTMFRNGSCLICQFDPIYNEKIIFLFKFESIPAFTCPKINGYDDIYAYNDDEPPSTVDAYLDLLSENVIKMQICDIVEQETETKKIICFPISTPMKKLIEVLSIYFNFSNETIFYLQKPEMPGPSDTNVDINKPNVKAELLEIKKKMSVEEKEIPTINIFGKTY